MAESDTGKARDVVKNGSPGALNFKPLPNASISDEAKANFS